MSAITPTRDPLSQIAAPRRSEAGDRSGRPDPARAGAAFLLVTSMLMVAERILAHQSGGAPKLDFIWPFDAGVYVETLARYGAAGRSTFLVTIWVDMIFPVTVAWFAASLLRATTRHWRILVAAPIAFVVLDVLENVSFLHMLASFPARPEATAGITSFLTTAKLSALALTYTEMLGCLATLAIQDRRRFFGLAATLIATSGLALCLYLAPIQSTIWNSPNLTPLVAWAPWVTSALGAYTGDLTPYYGFGRMVLWVYLGLAAGFIAAGPHRLGAAGRLSDRRAFEVLLVLLAIAAIGNVVEYWGGSVYGEAVKAIGFRVLETPALALAGLTSAWLGVDLLRRASGRGRRIGWVFLLTLPGMCVATALLQYLPHGPLLALSAVAVWLVLDRGTPDGEGDSGHATSVR
jgi:hypothetical protein